MDQILVGNSYMAVFQISPQYAIGSKLCWSPSPNTYVYYCIADTSCTSQDPDLGSCDGVRGKLLDK